MIMNIKESIKMNEQNIKRLGTISLDLKASQDLS